MLKEILLSFVTLFGDPAADAPAQPASAPAAQKLEASQVVDRVQHFYESTDRLTAKFRQHVTNKAFGKTTKSDGRVFIKKPGKMRWDYYARVRGKGKPQQIKSFISDGVTLWGVEHDNKQVYKTPLENDVLPAAVTFLYGRGDLNKDFAASFESKEDYGRPGEYVLRLVPKAPSAGYKTLWLVVNPDNFRVRRSIVLDSQDNVNAFTFYEPDLAKAVSDSWFVFNEKKHRDYRVIDPKDL